jgi:signal transduction histidine kinase
MKGFYSRHASSLIVLSLVVSIALQAAWLRQLFLSQRVQIKKDIEQAVSAAAIQTTYASVREDLDPGIRFKEFFLSPQWAKMRQAFDDIAISGVHSSFHYQLGTDSSEIRMWIGFNNKEPERGQLPTDSVSNRESPAELERIEADDVRKMNAMVRQQLAALGIKGQTSYALFNYAMDTLTTLTIPTQGYGQAAYRSARYSYNLKCLHKYQLVVGAIDPAVFYRMRYYLLSSLLLIVFTGAAFYFLLRLMRNQRLYADARADFTGNMTHELKTPVATVFVALESITRYRLIDEPERLQHYLDISRQELQRLDHMIEKVLDLNQHAEAAYALRRELYDVQAGLRQVISTMQVRVDDSRSVIHLTSSPEPCFVFGDPVHLENVFYNLIDNALKYAGPRMDLQIDCHMASRQVRVGFKDNGPGIDPIYRERIFERFFRVPSGGNTHNSRGSGLGLHYARQILGRHKGTISVNGEPGKGCNFIIILPAAI